MKNVLLKIVVVYSDKAAGQLGSRLTETLRRTLGDDFRVAQSVWRTELLKSDGLRKVAAEEARESDLIIVATSSGGHLPEEVESWFRLWKDRKRRVPGALVALVHQERGLPTGHITGELRQWARRARMEFFCHASGAAKPRPPRRRIASRVNRELAFAQ